MTQTATPAPVRSDFRFFDRLRVRWAEVDMQKIVFNGHYLMYFDTAVAGYWRALALPYHETMEALHGDLYVRKATLEYEASARYDDACDVGLRCARIGNSSMVFSAAVFRGEQRLVHGELVYVFADPATQTSRPVPPALRAALDRYEAGGSMLDVETAPWPGVATETAALRQAVWADELGLPEAAAVDGQDPEAWHALARNRMGLAVGCGRLVVGEGRIGEIGRMSVLHAVRGGGVGRALLAALVAQARQQRLQTVRLQAQRSAVGFYARAGFVVANAEPMVLAGVPHVPMGLRLA
jgi:YbgC/YbaW family acyl-CoA thioester hydrolase